MHRKSITHALGTMSLVVAAQACASQAVYIPEERATATMEGRTAASYPLPSAENEQGHVRVASYGVSVAKNQESARLIHLRLAVSGSGKKPVTVIPDEQRLQLPNGRQLAPSYAHATAGSSPVVTVRPGTVQVLDLYFKLDESEVPSRFDVVWRMSLGDHVVSRITPFDKVSVDPAEARQEAADDMFHWEPRYRNW